MEFKRWLENNASYDEFDWRSAMLHAIKYFKGGGPWEDPHWHEEMVRRLRAIGMNNAANDLEMIRPSKSDIDYGNTPMPVFGGTVGHVMGNNPEAAKSFKAAHRAYRNEVDHLLGEIIKYAQSRGWKWAF